MSQGLPFFFNSVHPPPPYPDIIQSNRTNTKREYIHQDRIILKSLNLRAAFLTLSHLLVAVVIGLGALVDTVDAANGRDACQTGIEKLSVLVPPQFFGFFGGIVFGVVVVVVAGCGFTAGAGVVGIVVAFFGAGDYFETTIVVSSGDGSRASVVRVGI